MLLAGLSGCMTPEKSGPGSTFGQANYARQELAHVQGPMGTPVPVGYTGTAQLTTPKVVQTSYLDAGNYGGVQQAGLFRDTSGGGCTTCGNGSGGGYIGGNPGGGGFGSDLPRFHPMHSGIVPVPGMGPAGAVAAIGALPAGGPQMPINARTSVRFAEPAGMNISWYGPNGLPENPLLQSPARYNFLQGGIYRLKIWGIQNQPTLALFPTLEVYPATPKTATYLAHSSVPVSFSDEDFAQVASGNFLVKVIYLPDPQFQDISTVAGPSEVVSSRLEPGADPIVEAQKRGTILLVIRVGNIDLQAPFTPAMDAPNPYMGGPGGPAPAAPPMSRMMPSSNGLGFTPGTNITVPPISAPAPSATTNNTVPPLVLPKTPDISAAPITPTVPSIPAIPAPTTTTPSIPATPTSRPNVLPTLP